MKEKIYNFATIEMGEMYRGPGVVIGVIAIAAGEGDLYYRFRDDVTIKEDIKSLKASFTETAKAAKDAGLNGLELFRAIAAPRQASIRFTLRGTRYCIDGREFEMMRELLERFTPKTLLV